MTTNATAWNDGVLTDDELSLIREAGASDAFLEIVTCDASEYGVGRNSSLSEVKKQIRLWGDDTPEALADSASMGGDFYSSLWDGNLWRAMRHADGNNARLMTEVIGLPRINADAGRRDRTPYRMTDDGRVVWVA